MEQTGIYIDYKNKKQVEWWNNTASKLVKVEFYNEIIETKTNKPVGVLLNINGFLKNYVIKENEKFLTDPTTIIVKV